MLVCNAAELRGINPKRLNDTEGFKEKPIKPETLEMWFFISLGVVFELVAILTAYLSQSKSHTTAIKTPIHNQVDNSSIGFKPTIVTANTSHQDIIPDDYKPIRPIGFHKENIDNIIKPFATQSVPSNIDNEILNKYLEYIYNNVKVDKSIPGYQMTAKDLKLNIDYVRKLKNHCEQLNIIESKPLERKTFIIKPRNEILSLKYT